MGTIWVKDFTGGLDATRLPESTVGGVLIKATNGHITRGGEFEKAKAFSPIYTLPEGTKGLFKDRAGLVVFGSEEEPLGVPAGISYQRLQHTDGVTALQEVLHEELNQRLVYAVAEFEDGSISHYYDGDLVTDWFDGRARASFDVIAGTASPASTLSTLRVNGVDILSAPVVWATSNEATAALIAAEINSDTSVPEYTATAVGPRVNIIADDPGPAANGFAISYVVADGLTFSKASGTFSLAGGAGDGATYQPGTYVKTIGDKLYSVSGENLHFSGIKQPTKWQSSATGAGAIVMSSVSAGLEDLVAVAKYQQFAAIFAAKTIQTTYIDPDPTLYRQLETLENTGTQYPRSVTKFGDNDIFYVDGGVRSLQARDSSNAPTTTDVGVPVDPLVAEALAALSASETRKVIGIIEPGENRFWLAVKQTIFVFSFFNGKRVSAWTTYDVGFEIENLVTFNGRVYARSGDTIYVFGAIGSGDPYDETAAEAWLPYLDANDPTRTKTWTGIDVALQGEWEVSASLDPNRPDAYDVIARVDRTTYGEHRIPFEGSSTHISLRFKSFGGGARKLSSAVIHYEGDADED